MEEGEGDSEGPLYPEGVWWGAVRRGSETRQSCSLIPLLDRTNLGEKQGLEAAAGQNKCFL